MAANQTGESQGPNYQVRALDRALDILDAFSLSIPELSLTSIAAAVDLPVSTTKRLIAALEERGYVERSVETDQYRIGIRAFEVGSIYIQTTTVEAEARPSLEQLAKECQQTANLGVLSRGEVVHIAVVPPDRPIRYFASVGEREKVYCTGIGKALVVDFSDEQLAELSAAHPMISRTRRTVTSLDHFRLHMSEVREQGYAMDDEESVPGVRCIAAPIRNEKGDVVAALSISGPAFEFAEDVLPAFVQAVLDAARQVSNRLGHAIHPAERVPENGLQPELVDNGAET